MQKLTMRANLPFVLLPVLILCLSLGSAYRAYAHADDEAAVRDALMKSAMSFEKNDLPMATQVWVNDESLTIFESGPERNLKKTRRRSLEICQSAFLRPRLAVFFLEGSINTHAGVFGFINILFSWCSGRISLIQSCGELNLTKS
jgi:hypothetical protein